MAKRKQTKFVHMVRQGEVPTVERKRQLGGTTKEVIDRDVSGRVYMMRYCARTECMLDAYLIQKKIPVDMHEAGMKYRKAWLRARCGVKVTDRNTVSAPVGYEESVNIVYESERILREADGVLTLAQRRMIIRVCCEDKKAGGTDALETLRRGLVELMDLWCIGGASV